MSPSKEVKEINSFKRKHNISPQSVLSQQVVKSAKGNSSPDNDNSSDSGISGDLAEDLELVGSNPVQKESLLIEEISEPSGDYFVSAVQKMFGGKISTVIKCLNCKTESIHKDVFTDINLSFQETDQRNATTTIRMAKTDKDADNVAVASSSTTPPTVDLKIEDMLTDYLTPEKLTGENKYECEKCKSKQDAERSIEILQAPEHLILIQLRFYYDTSKGQRQKVFTNVDFGENLSLPTKYEATLEEDNSKPVLSPSKDPLELASETPIEELEKQSRKQNSSTVKSYKYALYGVVVHSGFSSEGGHYYCYARNSSIAALSEPSKEK